MQQLCMTAVRLARDPAPAASEPILPPIRGHILWRCSDLSQSTYMRFHANANERAQNSLIS
jgi:hypothetical protein